MIPSEIEIVTQANDKLERLRSEKRLVSIGSRPLRSRLAVWLVQTAAWLDLEAIRSDGKREARV